MRSTNPSTNIAPRKRIVGEGGVAEVQAAGGREGRAGAAEARREHAVEHVYSALDHFEDALRVADAHEIPGTLGREERRGTLDRGPRGLACLADGQAAERVAVEV